MAAEHTASPQTPILGAVTVLALIQFVIIVDETVVALIGPGVARDWGLGAQARHVLVTPFALAFICALAVTAVLLRRADPRGWVAVAALGFGLSAAAGGLAHSLPQLVVTRALQGAFAAVCTTCVLGALHLLTRGDRRRVRAFAGFSLLSGSGALAGLLVFAPVVAHSWRWCFWAIGASAVACTAAWVVIRRRVPALVAAVRFDDVAEPKPARQTLIPLTFAATVAANAVLAATVITVSFVLQQNRGWSPAWVGVGFLPLNGAAAVGAIIVGLIGEYISAAILLASGFGGLAVGCGTMAVALGSPTIMVTATVAVGLGVGVLFPLTTHVTLRNEAARPTGRAAVVGALQQTGLAVGALIAAARSGELFGVLTVILAVAMVGAAVVGTRRRPRRERGRFAT